MHAVRSLCTRVVEIDGGHVVADGNTDDVVSGYVAQQTSGTRLRDGPAQAPRQATLSSDRRRPRWIAEDGRGGPYHSSRPLTVEIEVEVYARQRRLPGGLRPAAAGGQVFAPGTPTPRRRSGRHLDVGRSTLRCVLPAGMLNEGSYAVAPRADVYRSHWIVHGDDAIWFEVIKDHSDSPFSWISNPGPSRRCSTGRRCRAATPSRLPWRLSRRTPWRLSRRPPRQRPCRRRRSDVTAAEDVIVQASAGAEGS